MKHVVQLIIGIFLGATAVFVAQQYNSSEESNITSQPQPLYWVAPMDANYKRDKPGKSPMGMDLVPVYETAEDSAGTVSISPTVVNNLGVKTTTVKHEVMRFPIQTVGYVQYNEDKLIHIHPRLQGWVEKLHVKAAGERVKQGQPLYSLYSPELVNAQEEFLLAVKRNNPTLINASRARLSALHMPKDAMEKLEQSQQVMQTINFLSPQEGVIDNLNIRKGFYVEPSTTMMSIGSLEQVWVEAEIFERHANLISTGLPVSMSLHFIPGRTWQGKVDFIYPTVTPETRTLRVRLRFDNQDRLLKPNMFAQVTIHSQLDSSVLVIPQQALIRSGHQDRVVLALGEGKYKSVAVTVGQQNHQYVHVLSGLEEGDEVVTSAQFLLDSESSIDSDFMRLSSPQDNNQLQQATVEGTINSIDQQSRILNISREAIEKWSRGPATMNFLLAQHIDISTFQPQQRVEMSFEIRANDFVITAIHPIVREGQE